MVRIYNNNNKIYIIIRYKRGRYSQNKKKAVFCFFVFCSKICVKGHISTKNPYKDYLL